MSRLAHSLQGTLSQIAMRGVDICAICEGVHDRPFLRRFLSTHTWSRPITFDVKTSQDFDSALQSNKSSVVLVRSMLMNHASLKNRRMGQTTSFVFLLDKDVDDDRGTLIPCAHVCYTSGYSIENDLIEHGHLLESICKSTGLPPSELMSAGFQDPAVWTTSAVREWSQWAAACLVVARLIAPGTTSMENFGTDRSMIHVGCRGGLSNLSFSKWMTKIADTFDIAIDDVRTKYDAALADVVAAIGRGQHGQYFPGKWYWAFITEDLQRYAKGRELGGAKGIRERTLYFLIDYFDYDADVLRRLRDTVEGLLA